jgi:hypothetical protein
MSLQNLIKLEKQNKKLKEKIQYLQKRIGCLKSQIHCIPDNSDGKYVVSEHAVLFKEQNSKPHVASFSLEENELEEVEGFMKIVIFSNLSLIKLNVALLFPTHKN